MPRRGPAFVLVLQLAACDRLLGGLGGDDEAEEASEPSAAEPAAAEPSAPEPAAPSDTTSAPAHAAKAAPTDPAATPAPDATARVAWHTALTATPIAASIADDGTLVLVFEDRVRAYLQGAQVWEHEGRFSNLARLQDGALAFTKEGSIVVYEATNGAESFAVEAAPAGKGKDATTIVATAAFGSQLMIALSDARFLIVDPPTCAAKKPACLRPAGQLEGEFFEPGTGLVVADDGTRFLIEGNAMRGFDLGLAELFDLSAATTIVGVVPVPEGRIGVAYGGAVALLDVAACDGKSPLLGRNGAGPKGCVLWRYHADLDLVSPAAIDGKTLAANGVGRLQAVADGTDSWKSPIGSIGRVIAEGGLLYTMCVEDGESGAAASVKAVDAVMGTVSWKVALPFAIEKRAAVTVDGLRFDRHGGWMVAGLAENVAVLEVPAPSAAAAN